MILSAGIGLVWAILAISTGDRRYLLGTVIVICAEMAWHARCYVALARHALSKIKG